MTSEPEVDGAITPATVRAFLGLGSNVGDSRALLAAAVAGLEAATGVQVVGLSRVYRTSAVGLEDQPDFLNIVVEVATSLGPIELLDEAQRLEREAGRERTVRWGPRTLDVDVLWYDGILIDEQRLQVPHPRMEERRFVLEPLAELDLHLTLPSGRSVCEALADTLEQAVEVIDSPKG